MISYQDIATIELTDQPCDNSKQYLHAVLFWMQKQYGFDYNFTLNSKHMGFKYNSESQRIGIWL